jgi:ASC-1-like (ASCH) protein
MLSKHVVTVLAPHSCDVDGRMSVLAKNVSEPWFTLIASRAKSVEGRLDQGDFSSLRVGDSILWTNSEFGYTRDFSTRILRVTKYPTFEQYLLHETLEACLPAYGVNTIEEGVRVYRQYYDKADEERFGVLAIQVTPA